MDYFNDVIKIGLTATPKDYLKNLDLNKLQSNDPRRLAARMQRDTYTYFDCNDGNATYQYNIQDGVKDGYLVPAKIYKMYTDITQKSLTEEGFVFDYEGEKQSVKITQLEKRVSAPARNKLIVKEFLEHAQKTPDGKIGKTIVFAVSQQHATDLEKIFDEELGNTEMAVTITSRVQGASALAKEFRDKTKQRRRIAISVDMLTTGFDAPEVQNIVLARPVFEPTLYQQIKGRGTRLCPEIAKDHFVIFDFCGVAEYFEEKYDWEAPKELRITKDHEQPIESIDEEELDTTSASEPAGRIVLAEIMDNRNEADLIEVGPEGDMVDRRMYQNKWEEQVKKEFTDVDLSIFDEDDEQVEEIVKTRIFDRPQMFFNEDTLQKAFGVVGTIKDFVLHALGIQSLPSPSDQLEDWKRGMIEKYGIDENSTSQDKKDMVEILVKELMENETLREELLNGQEIQFRFLQDTPLNVYSPQDWLQILGREKIQDMLEDFRNNQITKIL